MTMQNKIIAKKILPVYKYTTLKIVVTPSFNGSVVVLFLIVIFCSAIKRSVRRHGLHCCSSSLGEVRIPRRTAARAYFVVINKDD